MTGRTLIILFFALTIILPVRAEEIGGVTLPDTLAVDDEQLVLNGAGLRKKLFIKVYAGGLYLKKKDKDAQRIIESDDPMAIRMHFIYDGVSSEKLISTWNEGFDKATGGNIAPIKESIAKFNSFFTEEAQKGDIYDILYNPAQGVAVNMKGKLMGTIKGLGFKKALFAVWLGKKPADKSLKKGMLGN